MDIYSESGRVKSLEKKFLTSQQIQRLVEAKNIGEFVSIAEKSFYILPLTVSDIEEIIEYFSKERESFYEEIEKHAPSLLKVFLIKNDFFNLKLIAEGKEDYIYPGNLPPQILKRSVEEKRIEVPDFLKKAIIILKMEKDIEEKLLRLKNEYYSQLYNLLTNFNSDFITGWGKIEIDFANLSTFIIKRKKEEKIDKKDFIENGNLKREKFINEEILFKSLKSHYREIKIPVNEENFQIEKYRITMNYIKRGRIIPSGIETVFSYFIAREIEMETVQRLFSGKFYNIEESRIKNWVIPPYQWR